MARTCCPQYTIRLDSTQFKPDKKHRQVINRFNRYLATGEKPGEASDSNISNKGNGKGKGKGKQEGSWIDTLRECQTGYSVEKDQKHTFRVSPHFQCKGGKLMID
jgi:arginine-tRNA-protein transferase